MKIQIRSFACAFQVCMALTFMSLLNRGFQRAVAAEVTLGEGIVVVRPDRLVAVPLSGDVVNEIALTSSDPQASNYLNTPRNPVYPGHGFLYFDADPVDDNRRPYRLGLFDLAIIEKLTTDPFGNSIDMKPIPNALLEKPYLLFLSNRTGSFGVAISPTQSQGPGGGTYIPAGGAYAWSRTQSSPPVAFVLTSTGQLQELEFPDDNPSIASIRSTIIMTGISLGTVSHLDTARGDRLLVSAGGGIYLGAAGNPQLARLRTSGRDAVFRADDPDRIAFAEVPAGESDYEIFTARITPGGLTDITRITTNDEDDLHPAWFVMPAQPSIRISGNQFLFRVQWPRWMTSYKLETTQDLSPSAWAPWTGAVGISIYEKLVSASNLASQGSGFFRLRIP